MDSKELTQRIERVKEYSPELFNDVLHLVVPFYLLHQKVLNGVIKLQENKYNISHSELDVLRCLKLSKNKENILSPTKIYEKLMFTSGAITKVLKKLEDKKYIIRVDNEFDKRSKLVQLTQEGNDICTKALIDVFAYEEECFSKLNKEEREEFTKLTLKLLA